MRKIKLTVLFAMAVLAANAQSKLDLLSQSRLEELREQVETSALQRGMTARSAAMNESIDVVVKMVDGTDAASLADKGFDVKASRAEFGVVSLPLARIDELNAVDGLESIEYGAKLKMKLSVANTKTGVDKVHLGTGLEMPYTGKGVFVADVDQGFDPMHPMFLDKDGKTRVKYYWSATSGKSYKTPEEIAAVGVDVTDTYHGSHVLGIASGNYVSDDFSISGVATGSDIAMATYSRGTDAELISIMENLIAVAQQKGEPLVINLSLGTNEGAHDGSSNLIKYMNKVIADKAAVICIAAGNEGTYPIVQRKTFASDDDEMTAYLYMDSSAEYTYGGYKAVSCSLWADGADPFSVQIVLYNTSTRQILKKYDPIDKDANVLYNSNGNNADADFAKYFSGTLRVKTGADGLGKYGVSIKPSFTRRVSNVLVGYIVKAKSGRTVTCYSSDMLWLVKGIDTMFGQTNTVDADNVTPDGTINQMAAGSDAIIVGSYNSRGRLDNILGENETLKGEGEDNKEGDISSFSSWGTINGVSMPDIAAPGAIVESATTTAYQTKSGDTSYSHTVKYNGKDYYWRGSMGTSMATPYMSGVAALWLEADPTLSNNQIKEIAKKTAIKDSYVNSTEYPVQFGAGKIDAYSGLKYVLDNRTSSLRSVAADKDMLFRALGDGSYEAYVAGENAIAVRIYGMDGNLVYSNRTAGNTARFSTSGMPKGIYAVELCGAKTSHKVKIAVK